MNQCSALPFAPLLRLVGALFVLPAVVTYFYLQHDIASTQLYQNHRAVSVVSVPVALDDNDESQNELKSGSITIPARLRLPASFSFSFSNHQAQVFIPLAVDQNQNTVTYLQILPSTSAFTGSSPFSKVLDAVETWDRFSRIDRRVAAETKTLTTGKILVFRWISGYICLDHTGLVYCQRSKSKSVRVPVPGDGEGLLVSGNYYFEPTLSDPSPKATEATSSFISVASLSINRSDDATESPRSPSSSVSSWNWILSWIPGRQSKANFRRNPNRQQASDSTRDSPIKSAFFHQPATSLLILVQVVLAFIYWSRRTPVTAVAKMYLRMIPAGQDDMASSTTCTEFEIWRCLTGPTAHFEPWHLGLNMMSLAALGQELEGTTYSSMAFFQFNLSLILWTSSCWLGLQTLVIYIKDQRQRRRHNNMDYHNPTAAMTTTVSSPTVGYSGVLFTWMVIVALEQQVSCPIPFVPDFCFHAFAPFGSMASSFQFNWGPVVQLVFMQVVLPRVSWTGHLAGILVGFVMHWGLLPALLLQPAISLPLLYYIYLSFIRRIFVPAWCPPCQWVQRGDEFGGTHSLERLGQLRKEGFGFQNILLLVLNIAALLLSASAFGLFCSLTISYFFVVLFVLRLASTEKKQTFKITARALLVTAVLVQITDAVTFGSWVGVAHCFGSVHLNFTRMCLVTIFLRSFILMLSIIMVAFSFLEEDSQVGGIFYYTLHYLVLHPAKAIARSALWKNNCQRCNQADLLRENGMSGDQVPSSWMAVGHGRRLGGGGGRIHSRQTGEQDLSPIL